MDKISDDTSSFPSFAADIHHHLGLVLLRDIEFDPATGRLTATQLDPAGVEAPLEIEIHPDDRARITEAAGADSLKTELRMASGADGNVALVLLDCRGGTAWSRGAVVDLPTPAFALEKLATRSRLVELGKQCAAVAHEIRQPLFTIAMASENLRLSLTSHTELSPLSVVKLDHIQEEVERARTIVDQTLNYAAGRSRADPNAPAGGHKPPQADLVRAIDHATRLLSYQMERADIALAAGPLEGPLPVAMPQIELEQVLLNIVRNSVESIEARKKSGWSGGGTVEIAVELGETQLCCTIADNGTGLGGAEPESGFQPFVTTKGEDGNGLGLYVCEQLLEKAGGHLKLLPGDREGAKVEITLPR